MNLILIGLRGSGKTTAGRLAAARLGWAFVDLDDRTAAALGCATVAEAWRRHGEPAFRAAETRSLREAVGGDSQVLALGGGTPMAPGAAELLRTEQGAGRARVLYLAAPAEELRARLTATDMASRPSLTGTDPLAEIEAVLTQRDGLYRGIADTIVCTKGLTIGAVATQIADGISDRA